MKAFVVFAVCVVFLVACGSSVPTIDSQDGQDGTSCTVQDNGDDTYTLTCSDGTEIIFTNGVDGVDGINGDNGADGTDGINGDDGDNGTDGINGRDGQDGRDGTSCTVQAVDGTYTLTCSDGSKIVFTDGADGRDGVDGENGIGVNGINGRDGSSCTILNNGDHTYTLSCSDGTEIILTDGINGVNGVNGVNGDDGTDGDNGTDGTDGINGTNGTNGVDGVDGVGGYNGTNGYISLIRIEDELAGDNCARGGSAIHTGLDTDTDNYLDDQEITQTAYLCDAALLNEQTLYTGDYIVLTLIDLFILQSYIVVTGSVTIDGSIASVIDLPHLQFVGGDLIIQNNADLTRLDMPSLIEVGSYLYIKTNDALTDIGLFDDLQYVHQSVIIEFNPELLNVNGFNSLIETRSIYIRDNDSLLSIDGFNSYVNSEGVVSIIRCPVLTNLSGFNAMITNKVTGISYTGLTHIDAFASLINVGTFTLSFNTSLDQIGFENLASIISARITTGLSLPLCDICSFYQDIGWENIGYSNDPIQSECDVCL